MPSQDNKKKGALAEDEACRYLEAKGYSLRDRNYRTRHGEIDLIMVTGDGSCLVFVEVKSGNRTIFPGYLEAIDDRKCKKIAQVACEYIENKNSEYTNYRIDAVFVEKGASQGIQHLENVFCMT